MAKDINIGGRLHSIATGNVVAGTDEILDDNLGKKQTQINTETYSLVESVNNALAELSPDQQEALAVAAKANANEAKLGYYVCDTDANIAAKTVVATNYVLGTGGNIRIKMTNANTADAATLNINSTGAKALFYNGTQASSTNSWEAGEVIEVYYDGTKYQCASGGGGKFATGEKVNNTSISNTIGFNEKLVKGKAVYPIFVKINAAEGNNVPNVPIETTWEKGSTLNGDGSLVPDNNTIRTSYIDVSEMDTLIFGLAALTSGFTYQCKPTWYTLGKTLLKTPVWSAIGTDNLTYQKPSEAGYVIFVLAAYNGNTKVSLNPANEYGAFVTTPGDIRWNNLLLKVEEFNVKINNAEYAPIANVYWEQGSTTNHDGTDAIDSNCIRSSYIHTSALTKLYFTAVNISYGYELKLKPTWYNSTKRLLETPEWSGKLLKEEIIVPTDAYYLRLVVAMYNEVGVQTALTPTLADTYSIKLSDRISEWSGLLDKVNRLSNNEVARKMAPTTIKVASYNIGHFSHGVAPNSNISSANYTTALTNYKNLVNNKLNADLIGLCEYSAVFGKNTNNVDVLAKDVLFTHYGLPFADFLQSRFSCNALYSRVYIDNVKRQIYDCNQTAVITHTTAIKATDYYYIEADLWMAGKLVKLVMTHLAFDTNNPQVVADQISELITKFANTDRIILMGDWNVSSFEQFTPFVTAGYTIGNDGTIMTYSDTTPNKALDNIIVKGLDISDVGVVQTSGLSDHLPIYATITL